MTSRPNARLRFLAAEVDVEKRRDGSSVLRSPEPLRPYARAVGDWLTHWGASAPDRTFLAERAGDVWRRVSYRDALSSARRIGQALLDLGLGATRPIAILSENSVDHALLALGGMHAGIPVAPISPAYSLMSKDFGKLVAIVDLLRPGAIYAADGERFGAAMRAVHDPATVRIVGANGSGDVGIAELLATEPRSALDDAFDRVEPDTAAKVLFTSGSTGVPKGVVNTHRMLCANQQMLAQAWPFLDDRVQTLVDWLPWNHTFGGNFCFNLVLRSGGTLYIDGGKPAPGLIETTARNLTEIAPTLYFNVPRGFDLLASRLEEDAALRHNFFSELDAIFYAAAALPQNLWERITALVRVAKEGRVSFLSGWGSTETSPCATVVHYDIDRAGIIGLPVPGCELKLVPAASKLEARVKGPHVTPGYYRRPDLTETAFDQDGFYRIGDAVKFADALRPQEGLVFDGRVAEDFKLTTGTWVHVGAVRVGLIAAGDPIIQDAAITGHDRDEVGALVFLSPLARELSTEAIRARIADALDALAADGGSSTFPSRVMVMTEPPSIDANEITDKGYLNQRAIIERRAALVDRLHATPCDDEVIVVTRRR